MDDGAPWYKGVFQGAEKFMTSCHKKEEGASRRRVLITSLLLFWCPYMVINVSVQCNGGLLPDIILLTLCDSIGEPF